MRLPTTAVPRVLIIRCTGISSRAAKLFPDVILVRSWGMLDLPDLAIRNGPWKLLCDYDGSRPFLYNIFKDHGEKQNLALDPLQAENVKTLTQQVVDWHLSMPPDNGSNFK